MEVKMISIYDTTNNNESSKVLKDFYCKLNLRREEGMQGIADKVSSIVNDVRDRGDTALLDYTCRFDGVRFENSGCMAVSNDEPKKALQRIPDELRAAIETAATNIRQFHSCQVQNSWFLERSGIMLGQLIRPLNSAGIYVPAGRAPLPSTVLMCAIPAKVAGVKRVVLVTPPGKDGKINDSILAAAAIAGIDEIYMVGGAQAIAALAFGTESIQAVDKIAGPGSVWVNAAKRLVYGYCGIDMFAGPSEICIIADETAKPDYIAADMLSQAEHDPLASSILITVNTEIAEATVNSLKNRISSLERADIALESLRMYGAIITVKNINEAIDVVNMISPEHLEICTKEPMSLVSKIQNAGSIFLGNYSPEPIGDYIAGPNHTLPTSGTARFFSPLGVYDFIKRSNIINYEKEALMEYAEMTEIFAKAEGLTAHEASISVRRGCLGK
jgi:histidinol dehydrogenase